MATFLKIQISPKAPTDRVVSVEDVKKELVTDFDDRDAEIDNEIVTATEVLQNYTGQAFLPSDVSIIVEQENPCWFTIPYANNADMGDNQDNLKGNRYYSTDKVVELNYSAGETKEWMKRAVIKYVTDLFDNKGDSRNTEVGIEAKKLCKGHIIHGLLF